MNNMYRNSENKIIEINKEYNPFGDFNIKYLKYFNLDKPKFFTLCVYCRHEDYCLKHGRTYSDECQSLHDKIETKMVEALK